MEEERGGKGLIDLPEAIRKVVVGVIGKAGSLAELVLNIGPDLIAWFLDRLEQAAGGFGDGFEVVNEGGAVGVAGKKLL
jgi:hypothetical protein